ncbi:MAG TPA: hypothetical protein VFQ15_08030 [Jiangellaceae bacterium]|nr:hypothetical protein [Jiangellaceae bacterium]
MTTPTAESGRPPGPNRKPWGAGRTILVVVGSVIAVVGGSLLAGGGAVLWAEQQRDADGFFTSDSEPLTTESYALSAPELHVDLAGPDALYEQELLGEIRIEAAGPDSGPPLFVGIGPTSAVNQYLDGVGHDEISDVGLDPFRVDYNPQPGGAPAAAPTAQTFWAESESGTGEQTLTWDVSSGDWSVVIMNADGSAGVQADLAVGATLPVLRPIAIGLLVVGGVLLLIGITTIVVTIATRGRTSAQARP